MRYKFIELYNYIGIYNGMGLTEIKIDFTKCRYNKIIIKGDNGSGKSTINNAIHPNPDSNDNFIPGSEARKNICLSDNGTDYIIRYIHPVNSNGNRGTTKGYISKLINGEMVELNPNGNISSCKDILYDEFNLDSSFISLSQLSTEDRGLVDRKPAERKKFFNKILNVLETYNNINKKMTSLSSVFKSNLNNLTSKIDYLGDETTIKLNLEAINNRINKLNMERDNTIEAIAAIKVKISEYLDILKNNNYDDIVSELNDVSKTNKSLLKYINNKLTEYNISDMDKVPEFIKFLDDKIISLQVELDSLQKQIPALLSQRETEYRELQDKQHKLDSLQSEFNYIDLKKIMTETKDKINEYDEVFNQMGLLNINIITKAEFDSAMDALKYIKESAINLMNQYNQDHIFQVLQNKSIIKDKISNLPSYRINLDNIKKELSDIDKEIFIFESKKELISELDNRPKGCNIDDCPFIKNALDTSKQFPEETYKSLIIEREELNNEIKSISSDINNLELLSDIIVFVENIERELKSKSAFIMKLPVRRDFEDTFLTRMVNYDKFEDIDKLYAFVDCGNMIEEYKILKQDLSTYESEYKLYESKNVIIESILSDIESLTHKTNDLASSIDSVNEEITDKQKQLENMNSIRSKVYSLNIKITDEYNPSVSREHELDQMKSSLDCNNEEIQSLQYNLSVLNNNLGSAKSDIDNYSKERDELNHSLILLSDYKKEYEEYNSKFGIIEKIKYYSSPTTGIQTVFMQIYMNKIISTANELLSLLFNGELVLQPFVINQNEFRIPCACLGLMHDDISSMSTAQKCMISMILSFSLLYQSSTKYNIIKLDEIDGGLDSYNRGYFINVLNNLMGMLNCEQCFIISHNNELDTSTADLIILKNEHNEIYNGNIIWQY